MKKRTTIPCDGCVWAEKISEGMIFCPFPKCVKGKLRTGQAKGKQGKRDG